MVFSACSQGRTDGGWRLAERQTAEACFSVVGVLSQTGDPFSCDLMTASDPHGHDAPGLAPRGGGAQDGSLSVSGNDPMSGEFGVPEQGPGMFCASPNADIPISH